MLLMLSFVWFVCTVLLASGWAWVIGRLAAFLRLDLT